MFLPIASSTLVTSQPPVGKIASTTHFFSYDFLTGPRTVIHPKARIIAEAGPIIIGEGNLIEEQALIINA
jgi:hypothetical protein